MHTARIMKPGHFNCLSPCENAKIMWLSHFICNVPHKNGQQSLRSLVIMVHVKMQIARIMQPGCCTCHGPHENVPGRFPCHGPHENVDSKDYAA